MYTAKYKFFFLFLIEVFCLKGKVTLRKSKGNWMGVVQKVV